MAFSDLASNQMVTEADASTAGFPLNAGQSNVSSNLCMTKLAATTRYNLQASLLTSYTDNQLIPKSVWASASDTTPPTIPTGLIFTPNADPQIEGDLSWTASTDNVGVAGYEIKYFKDGVEKITSISTINSKVITNTATVYQYGSGNYCWSVRAYDAAWNYSAWTAQVCQNLTNPYASSLVTATSSSLNVSWSSMTSANSYTVFYRLGTSGTFTSVVVGNVTSYTINSLTPSTNYEVYIIGVDVDIYQIGITDIATYSTTAVSLTAFSSTSAQTSAIDACRAIQNITYYHDGAGANPLNFDTIYTNSSGTIKLVGGNNYFSDGIGSYQVDNNGLVSNKQTC